MSQSSIHPQPGFADAKLTIVNPARLFNPSSFGYSHVVVAPAHSRVVHISGQGGADDRGTLSPNFADQVQRAYASLHVALEDIGAKPEHVAKLTIYVVDHDQSKLGVLTQAVMDMFGKTLPAQTLVPVPRLALDGMLFEVEAIAMMP
jgi:enamine deaminase RidA (YjgF/YER057c/UK114 family)